LGKLFLASIKGNKRLKGNYHLITLNPLEKIIKPKPGQFFMVSVDKTLTPLLKRPFSLHRVVKRSFQILYRVVGKATAILRDKEVGEVIEVLGPLGNGFPELKQEIKPFLVAGGLGIAPMFSLAENIADKNPLFFIGARNKKEILCVNELKALGIKPIIATDDGSMGERGTVVDIFNDFLTHHRSLVTGHCIYACGPKPMLKKLSSLTKKLRINSYGAFEENMACGVGACLGCVINTKDGFKRVCKEGPVFPLDEIVWERKR